MSLKILIADDSATNRLLFSMTLARLGHAVDTAVNGAEAHDYFRRNFYDLVFLDLNMPLADGVRSAAEINKGNERNTPVYAISGFPSPEMERRFEEAGIRRCIIKPLDRLKLEEVIRECGLEARAAAKPEEASFHGSLLPSALIRTYVAELRSRSHACEVFAEEGNGKAFYRECHTIRSLAQMLGMSALEGRALALESSGLPAREDVRQFATLCRDMADMAEKRITTTAASV